MQTVIITVVLTAVSCALLVIPIYVLLVRDNQQKTKERDEALAALSQFRRIVFRFLTLFLFIVEKFRHDSEQWRMDREDFEKTIAAKEKELSEVRATLQEVLKAYYDLQVQNSEDSKKDRQFPQAGAEKTVFVLEGSENKPLFIQADQSPEKRKRDAFHFLNLVVIIIVIAVCVSTTDTSLGIKMGLDAGAGIVADIILGQLRG